MAIIKIPLKLEKNTNKYYAFTGVFVKGFQNFNLPMSNTPMTQRKSCFEKQNASDNTENC